MFFWALLQWFKQWLHKALNESILVSSSYKHTHMHKMSRRVKMYGNTQRVSSPTHQVPRHIVEFSTFQDGYSISSFTSQLPEWPEKLSVSLVILCTGGVQTDMTQWQWCTILNELSLFVQTWVPQWFLVTTANNDAWELGEWVNWSLSVPVHLYSPANFVNVVNVCKMRWVECSHSKLYVTIAWSKCR